MAFLTAPRHYELLLILDPSLDERTVAPSIDTFLNVIRQGGGTVENVDIWGKRRLAFEIRKNAEGIYAVINVTLPVRRGRRAGPSAEPERVGAPHQDHPSRRRVGERTWPATPSSPWSATSPPTPSCASPPPAPRSRTSPSRPPRAPSTGTSGEWKDGEALFLRCNIWRQAAENVAESLTRGSRVIVTGRLKQRSFETKEGEKRTVIELEVDEIGPSLRYATAKVNRAQRSDGGGGGGYGGSGGGGSGAAASAPADDPWGSAPAAGSAGGYSDEPPF